MRSLFQQSDRTASHRHGAPVQITAVAERTSGLDENLGTLLRDMRLALRMTQGELALRLAASVDVIATLEHGRLRALPHWEETQRVIGGLCALHRVDPRPILQRIIEQTSPTHVGAPPERGPGILQRSATRTSPPVTADRTGNPTGDRKRKRTTQSTKPAAPERAKSKKTPKRWRKPSLGHRGGRVLMAVAAPMVLIAAAVWTIQAQPRALRDSIEVLPASIAQPMLTGLDSLAMRLAPRRDGLRWIDVADPSSRKADKLQVGSR